MAAQDRYADSMETFRDRRDDVTGSGRQNALEPSIEAMRTELRRMMAALTRKAWGNRSVEPVSLGEEQERALAAVLKTWSVARELRVSKARVKMRTGVLET